MLQKRCQSKDWKLGIEFEFTARATPQQNSLAEVSFATIANRGRAMMARAHVSEKIRYRIYSEAFKTATLLDGLIPIELDGTVKTRYEHWCGKIPTFAEHLRTWGEAGTVTIKSKMTAKVKDRRSMHVCGIRIKSSRGYVPHVGSDHWRYPRNLRRHLA